MTGPDYARAQAFALEYLARGLPPNLHYHNLAHTRDDVLPAAETLAAAEGVQGLPLVCLRTAACFHDIGYTVQVADHEEVGIRIAETVLPALGYTPAHLALIARLIRATRLPQQPGSLLENILADADLDSLGREDFLQTSLALRQELADSGTWINEAAWYARQLAFLRDHHYLTASAQRRRSAGKAGNIALLERLLRDLQPHAESSGAR